MSQDALRYKSLMTVSLPASLSALSLLLFLLSLFLVCVLLQHAQDSTSTRVL